MAELIPRYLDERVVQVVEGGVDETTALLAERFDHIFYTGNGRVGRIVMRAAAEHLTPVTLELGGKSPAIVAADADIDVAARRIAWGTFTNAGQTCIAPDYVLVAARVEDRFLGALLRVGPRLLRRESEGAPSTSDASSTSALRPAGRRCSTPVASRRSSPAAAATARALPRAHRARRRGPDAAVMEEEIFGPILPVIAVDDVDEAVPFVNDRPHPLALYVFSDDAATAERVVERTRSGGVDGQPHDAAPRRRRSCPFGGVGASGIGRLSR